MLTDIDEIADGVFRIAEHLEGFGPRPLSFNQFLVLAEEPLLVHTGMRSTFPVVSRAISKVLPLSHLRWVAFGHAEGDECGALGAVLEAARDAQVICNPLMQATMIEDLSCRWSRVLHDGEALDLGGRRVRLVTTPHVPHNAEAQVVYEEVTGTLFCGDLLAQYGRGPALVDSFDIIDRSTHDAVALASSPPGPAVPDALRRLAQLEPETLAVMHGSSFQGDGGSLLRACAGEHEHAAAALSQPA